MNILSWMLENLHNSLRYTNCREIIDPVKEEKTLNSDFVNNHLRGQAAENALLDILNRTKLRKPQQRRMGIKEMRKVCKENGYDLP